MQPIITRVSNEDELIGIQELQKANLRKFISEEEVKKEGFVTAEYSIEFLKSMHESSPSIIAKDGDKVVGYALVSTKAIMGQHELLDDLFHVLDKLSFNGASLSEKNAYVLVGQLCVGKEYRGMGLVQKMYHHFKDSLQDDFKYLITDVAAENERSLKAHIRTGFQVIHTIDYGGIKWDIVLWDWNASMHHL
jgi:ribosomal protein S18 acetylase RimI-like enzyme